MVDRRSFLKSTGAVMAAATLAGKAGAAEGSSPWKKAYMLGTSKGPILPDFEMLRSAGYQGVELLSPNELDRDEVLTARDRTGLVIHGVSGSRHWKDTLSDPDPQVVERGLAAIRKEMEDCKAYGGT